MATDELLEELELRPISRTEYEALGRLGVFDDEKVELLEGRIVYAAEEGPPHAAVCGRLNRILIEGIPAGEAQVRVGNPFALSDLSEPEPDFLVAPSERRHRAPGSRPSGFGSVTAHVDEVVRPLHHPGASVDVRQLLA